MEPVDLIIFGASGDLSARKLFPALYHLDQAGLLQNDLRVAAVARNDVSLDEFLEGLRERMAVYMGKKAPDETAWESFSKRISYIPADFSSLENYGDLKNWLDDDRISLFYLATPPSLFAPICEHLHNPNCLTGDCRIVIEKPNGEDLASSQKVNETLAHY